MDIHSLICPLTCHHKRSVQFILLCLTFVLTGCRDQPSADVSSKTVDTQAVTYNEKHRPQLHFSPPSGWMNDPNGLVYFEGEYHLFYQYYPRDIQWDTMHWGHAVSRDLVHWENLPIAIYPDELGCIFSGSAVIDWNNTTGFGDGSVPPMVAIFTQHNFDKEKAGTNDHQTQSIAYSLDKGRTWEMYDGNPVIGNNGIRDFRDPKVRWHEPSSKWIMTLAVGDHIRFYASPDLKDWTLLSSFGEKVGNHGGVWECPDLFPMSVENEEEEKWVLLVSINPGQPNGGSGTQYFVGSFDGTTFVPDEPIQEKWLDGGKDNYAGVTWSDLPRGQGPIYIGWMSNWQYAQRVPASTWRSAMTLPRKLELLREEGDYWLTSQPISKMNQLRQEAVTFSRGDLQTEYDLIKSINEKTGLYEVHLEFQKPPSGRIVVELYNGVGETFSFGYDVDQNEYFMDRLSAGDGAFSDDFNGFHVAPCYYVPETVQMQLYIDKTSIELFADEGRTVMTDIFFPSEEYTDFVIRIDEPVHMLRSRLYSLNPVW